MARRLQQNPLVKSFKFVSKEQALSRCSRTETELVQNLPFNPFPDTFVVTPEKAEDLDKLYARCPSACPRA